METETELIATTFCEDCKHLIIQDNRLYCLDKKSNIGE